MDKNGDTQQSPSVAQQDIKFSSSFTPEIDTYIIECQKNSTKPTVKGFATRIGTDVHSLWAWAGKKKKDDQGNITDQLARPNFNAALMKLYELEKKKDKIILNPRQELFCQLYAKSREHFGNAWQSYVAAYEIDPENKDQYNNARASASMLLANPNILQRVNELLGDLTEKEVDQELAYVVRQNYELPSKIAAIREFNKLKGRVTERIDHTTKGKELPQPIMGGAAHVPTDNSNA